MNITDYATIIMLNKELIFSDMKNQIYTIQRNSLDISFPIFNSKNETGISRNEDKNIGVNNNNLSSNKFISATNIGNKTLYRIIPDTTIKQNLNLNEIQVIGHRGNGENTKTNKFPLENTLESFKIAKEKGAQMVELDVHLTVDNKLIIFHDSKILNKWIYQTTYEEFEKLYNEHHQADHLKALTLQEVFEEFPEDFPIYIEIKYEETIMLKSHFPKYLQLKNQNKIENTVIKNEEKYPDSYIMNLVEEVAQMTLKNPNRKIIYASFSFTVCALLKSRLPNAHVLVLINDEVNEILGEDTNSFVCDFIDKFDFTGVIFDTKCKCKFEPILNHVKNQGKYLMCYGPGTNNEEEIKKLREFGVTGFCTDDVVLCKSVLTKMKNH